MRHKVIKWLAEPERDYAEGLELFGKVATPVMATKYLAYFSAGNDAVRLNMLSSKLRLLLPGIKEEYVKPEVITTAQVDSDPEGFDPSALTGEAAAAYERLKEIRPLQASLHADLSTAVSDDDRKAIVDYLLELEAERQSLWDIIEASGGGSNGDPVTPSEGGDPEGGEADDDDDDDDESHLSEDSEVLGKRLKQLRQNLSRGKCSAEKKNKYEAEMAEIEKKLADAASEK